MSIGVHARGLPREHGDRLAGLLHRDGLIALCARANKRVGLEAYGLDIYGGYGPLRAGCVGSVGSA